MIENISTSLLPVVCARMKAKRLPGKLMLPIDGKPMLTQVLRRIPWLGVVAIPENDKNSPLKDIANSEGWAVSFGPEDDVLLRIILAAREMKAENILRLTGDNPLIDKHVIIKTWEEYVDSGADYCAMAKLPAGMMVEIISLNALERLYSMVKNDMKLIEHPTLGFHTQPSSMFFRINLFDAPDYWQRPYRLTVDENEDLQLIRAIYKAVGPDPQIHEVINWLIENPIIARSNSHIKQLETIGIEKINGETENGN